MVGCKQNLHTWKQIAADKKKELSKFKEEEGEDETDTGIEEVNEEEEGEATGVHEIDDEITNGKDSIENGENT